MLPDDREGRVHRLCGASGGAVHTGGNCLRFHAERCRFRCNVGGTGGALGLIGPAYGEGLEKEVLFRGCDFDRNHAHGGGGGVCTPRSHAEYVMEDCTFRFNVCANGRLFFSPNVNNTLYCLQPVRGQAEQKR